VKFSGFLGKRENGEEGEKTKKEGRYNKSSCLNLGVE
jgi:hypothetical protein